MPYYSFKEIWTPLVFFGIRFFKELESGALFVKVGNRPRKQISGNRHA
ncbi:hypothetical protein [Ammoniphilus sp. 3BR4]